MVSVQSDAEFQERLGARIRKMRMERGISQEAFADDCGIHRTHQSLLERGKINVKINTLRLVTKTLRVSLSELVRGLG
jgi:transcriptional regulator with XRE-family HTH domain